MENLILSNLLKLIIECLEAEQCNQPNYTQAIQQIINPIHTLINTLEKKSPPEGEDK